MREFTYTVTSQDVADGLSIKDLLRRRFSFSSRMRSRIKREELVFVNEDKLPVWLTPKEGDVIRVVIPEETSYFTPQDVPIIPLYEDEDLLLIDKPAGYVCHPTKGHYEGTIANGIAKYLLDTGQSFKVRFINRLDMDTSGVLALAKNAPAQASLVRAMQQGKVEKTYVALLKGVIDEEEGEIDLPLGYDPEGGLKRVIDPAGKPSLTRYRVLERYMGYTLAELSLGSGRTHQIRVHMAWLGHPVAGDFLYGTEEPLLTERQLLHAKKLTFPHPVSGKVISCEAPLPEDFRKVLEKLR